MRAFPLILLCAGLAACSSDPLSSVLSSYDAAAVRQRAEQTCQSYGFKAGTADYSNCVLQQDVAARAGASVETTGAVAANADVPASAGAQ